jgi:hypothetical protein
MKTMRIFVLGIMALALALAPGYAEAAVILKVEDPALPDGVVEVVDNGAGDINALVGLITTAIDVGGISTIINAISRLDRAMPRLVLDLEGYETFSDSVKFSLTDTDFTVAENTPGRALVWGVQDAGNSSSFTFAGDANNGEFVEGFTLITYNETEPEYEFGQVGSVPALSPGSLTLSAVVEKGTNVEKVIETTFVMILQVGESTARDCPPFISNETISRLGTIGDGCVIQGSTIEDGDVNVKNVTGFSMTRSVVSDGDVDIEDVGGAVTVQRNRVLNGDIKITGTTASNVRGNIVNGTIAIRENDSPSVIRNAFSNNNMVVSDNTGSTVVEQNNGLESSNLEVDNNETVTVTNNTTGRDITCEDNDELIASGNEADRNLECPKDDGLFGGDGLFGD